MQQQRTGAEHVDPQHAECAGDVVGEPAALAEDADGEDHDVDVPRCSRGIRDHLRVALGLERVELQLEHALAAVRAQLARGARERVAVTSEQGDLARAVRLQLADDRERDLRRAAEHQHALPARAGRRVASGKPQHSSSRRARFERSAPPGSTRARSAWKRSSRGYIARIVSARMRASFVR